MTVNKLEIRVNETEGKVYAIGKLPILQASEILVDKQGKFFREYINKSTFSRAIASMEGYPKLLVNHSFDEEIPTLDFEAEESEDFLEFAYTLPLTEEVSERLQGLESTQLSFGFNNLSDRKTVKVLSVDGYEYDRIVDEMELVEISLLKGKLPCYSQSVAFAGSEEEVKTSKAKYDIKKCREEISRLQMKELEQYKKFIEIKKNNDKLLKMSGYSKV